MDTGGIPVYTAGGNPAMETKIQVRAYEIQKKIGVTTHFSEIFKPQFRKKIPYIVMYFNDFLNYCCLIISERCVVAANFLFGFQ